MSVGLEGVVLEGVPPLYGAAQSGDAHAAIVAMRRLLSRLRDVNPALAEQLKSRLPGVQSATSVVRRLAPPAAAASTPRDPDSHAGLVRRVETDAIPPVLRDAEARQLQAFMAEHRNVASLERAGLAPRSTLFLFGVPGVGKTMTAAWLASQLGVPLFQVELPALISSYLGRTGQNLREVFDFAREETVVLFLDEFDAVAKRRDDQTDLGELRRVVSVLLKEIEEWPGPSILVAATNHPELIDPAAFRRFQLSVEVQLPGPAEVEAILKLHLGSLSPSARVIKLARELLAGSTGSDIRNVALESRRAIALESALTPDEALLCAMGRRMQTAEQRQRFCRAASESLPNKKQASMAALARWLGVGRSTVHGYVKGRGKKE
ncbi:AAA family ATPase [Corallococcus coralloides]|uniref:AAA family ATPase n=1 Tax=Corallococcus coralloides TaxID=184914 RepID=UPI00384F9628